MVSQTKTAASAAFPKFQQLPLELRTQIWRKCLPGNITRPALYVWRPGCWDIGFRKETDPDYRTPRGGDLNLLLKFYHDRLGYTQFYIPMAAVGAEAFRIALTWAADQDVEVRDNADGGRPIFVRPFHPECDVVYVAPRDWDDFVREPRLLPYELDIFQDQLYAIRSELCRIAISEPSSQESGLMVERALPGEDSLLWVNLAQPAVRSLYVVVDPLPEARNTSGGSMSVPWRLEIEIAQGWELVWISDNKGVRKRDSFVREIKTPRVLNEDLHRYLAEASNRLHEGYMENVPRALPGTRSSHRFEVRLAHIVKV